MKGLTMEVNVEDLVKALAIQAEIEGMKAENTMRKQDNNSMAYWCWSCNFS